MYLKPMAKLTKSLVEALEPSKDGVKGSYLFAWDQELRGFGVQVMPSGLKSFILQYRNGEKRSRRIVIGRYGVMTVEEGVDPADEKPPEGDTTTIAEICDWYVTEAEAGRILGKKRRPIKPSTLRMDRSRIEAHLKPLLGKRQIGALKLGDIEGVQADIAAGKTSKPRVGSRGGTTTGGEGVASRTMSTLHAILEHAVRLGKIERNPAKGVRRMASTARKRHLSRAEIGKLGDALRAAEADGEHPKGIAAIRFLLLTGFRRMEGLGLQRAWLDDEEGSIRFPDTKSGAQTRVIGDAAIKVLLAQPQIGKSPFFFPAEWGDGQFIGSVRVLDRVCAMAKLEEVTPHTLRHTFASVAAELGFSELTIAALLGHAARGVTQRYIHIDEALMMTSDKVAQEIADLLDGRATAPRRRVRRAELTEQVLEVATADNEQP
jgi:integrase